MAEIASAYVSLMPSARGFGSKLNRQIGPEVNNSGKKSGALWGRLFAGAAALGAGALLKNMAGLEAEFSQTMNTVGAVTDVSAAKLANLSDLALKLGKDTSFSASEASDAMLELAKGGMTAATIQAGGLAGTLQLAAAGGTSMETAATIASNAMNAFSLKGQEMASVAAALAGGANASSASIESLGQGLSQVGPGAVNAGLSLHDTVAALSAFDAAGIKGSDAGTSLKTMLARLIPQTNKAAKAMDQLGLDFVKGDGSFESVTNIAGQLQERLGGLTEAQRSQALTTIFGSDASRAAAVLMKEGAGGIRGFIKATQDQEAAQRAADARMKGTAGAIEEFKGSVETAQIELGLLLGPAIQTGLAKLTAAVNQFGPALKSAIPPIKGFVADMRSGAGVGGALAATLRGVGSVLRVVGTFIMQNKTAVATFVGIIGTAIVVTKAWAAAQALLNLALTANPIGIAVVAIAALAAGLVMAYKKSATFRKVVDGAFNAVKASALVVANFFTKSVPAAFGKVQSSAASALGWVQGNWPKILAILTGPFGIAAALIIKNWDSIKAGGQRVVMFVATIPSKITGIFAGAATLLYNAGVQLMTGLASGITNKIEDAINAVRSGLSRLKGLLPGSPIKWGPLKNWNNGGAGKRLMDLVTLGITKGTPKTIEAAQTAFGKIGDALKSTRSDLQSTLAGLKSDFASLADSVAQAFTGDLFGVTATEAAAGVAGRTVGENFFANLIAKRADLTAMLSSFKTLQGWGLAPSFLSQLFASGNGALITELAGMGQSNAQVAGQLFTDVTNLGAQLGGAVATNDPVTSRIDETNRLLTTVSSQLGYLGSDIGKELNGVAAKAQRDKKNKKGRK